MNSFKNKILLNVKGKDIYNFIKKLNYKKIEILNLKRINKDEINILIEEKNLEKIKKIKTIYKINVLNIYGMIKLKKILKKQKILFTFFFLGIILLIFLSNVIFDIEIIHTNKELRTVLINELSKYNLKPFTLKKGFSTLQKIKEKIVFNNKDIIEWLEIERKGTKYIVRLEERIIKKEVIDPPNQNVIAKKSAIIKKIIAEKGEVVKNINDYVKPGDVIISGEIKLYDEVKNVTFAKGKVYGEVWYETKVTYPLVKLEFNPVNQFKRVLVFNFLNKKIELFKPYKYKKSNKKVVFKNRLLPFSLKIDKQQKLEKIEVIRTIDEAVIEASKIGLDKIKKGLKKDEYIISSNNLKIEANDSKIIVYMFLVVYEDITATEEIIIEETED